MRVGRPSAVSLILNRRAQSWKKLEKVRDKLRPAVTCDPTPGLLPPALRPDSSSLGAVRYPGLVACGAPEPGGILEACADQWRSARVCGCAITIAIINPAGEGSPGRTRSCPPLPGAASARPAQIIERGWNRSITSDVVGALIADWSAALQTSGIKEREGGKRTRAHARSHTRTSAAGLQQPSTPT